MAALFYSSEPSFWTTRILRRCWSTRRLCCIARRSRWQPGTTSWRWWRSRSAPRLRMRWPCSVQRASITPPRLQRQILRSQPCPLPIRLRGGRWSRWSRNSLRSARFERTYTLEHGRHLLDPCAARSSPNTAIRISRFRFRDHGRALHGAIESACNSLSDRSIAVLGEMTFVRLRGRLVLCGELLFCSHEQIRWSLCAFNMPGMHPSEQLSGVDT